jgi:hypothetical protein
VDSPLTTDENATESDYMAVITSFLDTKNWVSVTTSLPELQKAIVQLISKAYAGEIAQETERKRYSNGREEVLDTAKAAVLGDRNNHYGEPDQDFARTAALWNILSVAQFDALIPKDWDQSVGLTVGLCRDLVSRLDSAASVADKMVALKLSRNTHMRKLDNYVDIAGYAACGYEALLRSK